MLRHSFQKGSAQRGAMTKKADAALFVLGGYAVDRRLQQSEARLPRVKKLRLRILMEMAETESRFNFGGGINAALHLAAGVGVDSRGRDGWTCGERGEGNFILRTGRGEFARDRAAGIGEVRKKIPCH